VISAGDPRRKVGRRLAAVATAFALVTSGCAAPILANPPITFPSPAPPSAAPSHAPDPIPVTLPRDDGPHRRLTEWWYYTGHLHTETGRRFGFEAVVFRAERGAVPPAWAAHLALTDEEGQAFHYAQRSEIGTHVDHSPTADSGAPTGFDLQVGGLNPVLVAAGAPATAAPWRLAGSGGVDRIEATLSPDEAAAAGSSFGLQLDLDSTKPPALHDGDGFVDFGPAGSSYYYSRTRMTATGTVRLDGEQLSVDGIAWFDHQWGDFVSVGGGWDWFAMNFSDGTDMTVSVVRDADDLPILTYGTVVGPDGTVSELGDDERITVEVLATWGSPATGRIYPMGWRIKIDRDVLAVYPVLDDQELDTGATTGVVYWEGDSRVSRNGARGVIVNGDAYVEITRYGP
jgi:predicted secreted hydrolase